MSAISSCIDAIKLINSDRQTRDVALFADDGTFTDESREVVHRGPEELGDEETKEAA